MQYDPFVILQINEDATPQQIKAAYRRLAKLHHPDAGGRAEDFDRVQKAYDLLQDAEALAKWQRDGQEPQGAAQDPRAAAILQVIILHLDAALQEAEHVSIQQEMLKTMKQHQEMLAKAQRENAAASKKLASRLSRIKSPGIILDVMTDRLRKMEDESKFRHTEGELLLEAIEQVQQLQEDRVEPSPASQHDPWAQMQTEAATLWGMIAREAKT